MYIFSITILAQVKAKRRVFHQFAQRLMLLGLPAMTHGLLTSLRPQRLSGHGFASNHHSITTTTANTTQHNITTTTTHTGPTTTLTPMPATTATKATPATTDRATT